MTSSIRLMGRKAIIMMSTLPKLIYKFNEISLKIDLKIPWKQKEP